MVSAWACGQRIVLGQQATEEKSNEITAVPLLLSNLDLKGSIVTIDAMGTQTKIAQAIRDGGGDLRRSWPAVRQTACGHDLPDEPNRRWLQWPDRGSASHRL